MGQSKLERISGGRTIMSYNHWFVSRQKRQLTTILDILFAFNDVCVNQKWKSNKLLQLQFEDELGTRKITQHGALRARETKSGGGGVRTLITQLKDLGLIFFETTTQKSELTLIGEDMVSGEISFVKGIRLQLQRYQYPSATRLKGSGSVSSNFRVHPFQFMVNLLLDDELGHCITMDEMQGIVIHFAFSDSLTCFENVKKKILQYRAGNNDVIKPDIKKTYSNIANTFFNYITLTQLVNREDKAIQLRFSQIDLAREFVSSWKKFLPNPEYEENYQRSYGRGLRAKDIRRFDNVPKLTSKQQEDHRVLREFLVLKFKKPIRSITPDIIDEINEKTGVSKKSIEKYLIAKFPNGCLDDFFTRYRELAYGGRSQAIEFERATTEICEKIFGFYADHIGQKGRYPDVFIRSDTEKYCGIFDNKAYPNGYELTSSDQRAMVIDYIPKYQEYGDSKGFPLAFFGYIAPQFLGGIDQRISEISEDVESKGIHVKGVAIPVNTFIDIASEYSEKGYTHKDLKKLFAVNRELSIQDISALHTSS